MRPVYCPNELFLVAFVGITEPQVAGEQCVWYNACQHPFTETIKVWGVLHEGANYQLSTTGPDYSWIAYRRSFDRSALAVAGRIKPPKVLLDLIFDTIRGLLRLYSRHRMSGERG